MKLRKGSWRNLSGYAKQLICILSWCSEWPGISWVLRKNGYQIWVDESDSPCLLSLSATKKWISKHLFYWHNRVNDKEFGSVCLTKDIRGIYLEYVNAAYVQFGLLLSMNQNDDVYFCSPLLLLYQRLTPSWFYMYPYDMFTLNLLANLFFPFSLRSQSGLDPSL